MAADRALLETWRDVPIYLSKGYSSAGSYKFEAHYPNPDGSETPVIKTFDTHEEAREDINRRTKAKAKARKLSLPVMAAVGIEWGSRAHEPQAVFGTITGINMHTQRVTLTGLDLDKYSSPALYPRVPWIERHVERLAELFKEYQQLRSDLDAVKIDDRRVAEYRPFLREREPWRSKRYRGIEPENYDEALDALVREHADRVFHAELGPGAPMPEAPDG